MPSHRAIRFENIRDSMRPGLTFESRLYLFEQNCSSLVENPTKGGSEPPAVSGAYSEFDVSGPCFQYGYIPSSTLKLQTLASSPATAGGLTISVKRLRYNLLVYNPSDLFGISSQLRTIVRADDCRVLEMFAAAMARPSAIMFGKESHRP